MATITAWSPKDPQDVRDYWINFAPLGLGDSEILTAVTVTIEADQFEITSPYEDLTKVEHALAEVGDSGVTWVRIRVAGGTPAEYAIAYHVTTSSGQEFDLTKTLEVRERIE